MTCAENELEDVIDLEAQTPLARGHAQLIYAHPHYPDRLIKVISPARRHRKRLKRVFPASRRRYRALREAFRELEEYVALLARTERVPDYLPRFYGFVGTSQGPGQVVEKIRFDTQRLSPPLSQWREIGLQETEVIEMVDSLLAEVVASGLMVSDFHKKNIVLAGQPKMRLVIIDGIGGNKLWRRVLYLVPPLASFYWDRKRGRLLRSLGIMSSTRGEHQNHAARTNRD